MNQAGDAPIVRGEGFAAWALGGPMAWALGLVALAQLATWVPHYLTWPYWADHDVFATVARGWDLGLKPYRDTDLNNFPGTVYLFYALGKTVGWGKPWALYAADSALLVTLIVAMVAWSRRRFGGALGGWVGSIAFLSYYLGLDYCHTAQRDWQAPALVVLGLLLLQGWPGRATRVMAALLAALALATRPQVVVLLPALEVAILLDPPDRRALGRSAAWVAMVGFFTALAFLPVAWAGVFGDFLRSLRHVAYGSTYHRAGPASMAKAWVVQAMAFRWLVVPAGIVLLGLRGGPGPRRAAWAWLVALAGVSVYKPLSPMAHSYLDIPLVLIWSVNLSVLADLAASTAGVPASARMAAVLGLLGMGSTTLWPASCAIGPTLRAASALRSGSEPVDAPPGYRRGSVATSAFYIWADYRATLGYLRANTAPTTQVANMLKGDPAIASAVDRPSSFPAESIAWLRMVGAGDEDAFVSSLETAGDDSVVVWAPGEAGPDPTFRVDRLEAAVRRLYRFETRFGPIEVWRRSAGAGSP